MPELIDLFGDAESLAVSSPSGVGDPPATPNGTLYAVPARASAAAASGLQINVIFDQPVDSLPAAFVAGVEAAAARFQAMFSDNLTIDLHVGFGEVDGQTVGPGFLGRSFSHYFGVDSATVGAANPLIPPALLQGFTTLAMSASQLAAAQTLLGQPPATNPEAFVGFSTTAPWDYDDGNGVSPGAFDFFGSFAHELTETMGRLVGSSDPSSGFNVHTILDLFRFMNGQHDLNPGDATYFSLDGSATGFDFNLVPGFDSGDWATEASVGHDSFLATSDPGHDNVLSILDLTVMEALGWYIAAAPAAGAAGLFLGTLGGDIITGSSGADTIIGGPGGDSLTGGGGADTFVYQFASDSTAQAFDIIQDFQTGQDKIDLLAIQPSAVSVVRSNGVSFVFVDSPTGSMTIAAQHDVNGDDFITGGTNHGGFYLIGDNNGDTLIGSSLADPIQGGTGNDTIIGGAGADALFSGGGTTPSSTRPIQTPPMAPATAFSVSSPPRTGST